MAAMTFLPFIILVVGVVLVIRLIVRKSSKRSGSSEKEPEKAMPPYRFNWDHDNNGNSIYKYTFLDGGSISVPADGSVKRIYNEGDGKYKICYKDGSSEIIEAEGGKISISRNTSRGD